jgi:hypothetical protein
VAAERRTNGVRSVTITSLAGNPCAVANPWGPGQARVVDPDTLQVVPAIIDERTIRFATRANGRYQAMRAPERADAVQH